MLSSPTVAISATSATVAAVASSVVTTAVMVVVTTWKEEDKKCKLKKSHFSEHLGFVLRENKLFFGNK